MSEQPGKTSLSSAALRDRGGDATFRRYFRALASAGGVPVLLTTALARFFHGYANEAVLFYVAELRRIRLHAARC
jgi:hypothetical protein